MTNIERTFKDALNLCKEDHIVWKTLNDKFNDIRKVLDSNFVVQSKKRNWNLTTKVISEPALKIITSNVTDKNDNKHYLYVEIQSIDTVSGYVFGLNDSGDMFLLKGCCSDETESRNLTVVCNSFFLSTMRIMSRDYCIENKITLVQFFTTMIKAHKDYLVKELKDA